MPTIAPNIEPGLIEDALIEIFESAAFRSSRQCQILLRYIVHESLAGHTEALKERVIGVAVFGRPPDYDAGNDPVVRGRVAEIRKRLAQFYMERDTTPSVQIAIPSGSYLAYFTASAQRPKEHRSAEAVAEPDGMGKDVFEIDKVVGDQEVVSTKPVRKWRTSLVLLGLAGLVVASGISIILLQSSLPTDQPFREFWLPITRNPKPALIYIGSNYTYKLSHDYMEAYRLRHGLPDPLAESSFVHFEEDEKISQKDLRPVKDVIGFGDVASTGRVIATLSALNKNYDLRYGDDVTITDLKSAPAILIGGYSNPWVLQLTSGLRYTLERHGKIVDHSAPSREWHREATNSQEDYAIVTRLIQSNTGNNILAIAGISAPSNQAAADFIGDPRRMNQLLQVAPKHWDRMNMQLVLSTQTINDVPTSAKVEAIYFW